MRTSCDETTKAIYPGTFDPLTNGHLDLIARGAKIVDDLVVAILRNSEKGTPLFTVPEREEMIREATAEFGNVSVATFDGLLVDFARAQGAKAVLRGIRAISDYEYEFQMAMMNRKLNPELETLFMMPAEKYTYVSSRLIKGVFQLGGDVSALVPPLVMERLKAKASAATDDRAGAVRADRYLCVRPDSAREYCAGDAGARCRVRVWAEPGVSAARGVRGFRGGCECGGRGACAATGGGCLRRGCRRRIFRWRRLRAMPFPDGFADVVICNSVLHFARDERIFWRWWRSCGGCCGRAGCCFAGWGRRIGMEFERAASAHLPDRAMGRSGSWWMRRCCWR